MVEESQIRKDVREILARIQQTDQLEIGDEDDIFNLGLDSVRTILLITELENKYSVALVKDEIPYDRIRTISGIADWIANA